MRNTIALVLGLTLGFAGGAQAQELDICGCSGHPESLGDFVTTDIATYPPGWVLNGAFLDAPLPDDGVLIFDSFLLSDQPAGTGQPQVRLRFLPNAANTAVTLLVAGDFTIGTGDELDLEGGTGESGLTVRSLARNAQGALGGPGGYRGGDGGYVFILGEATGGAGLGPAGGDPGDLTSVTSATGNGGNWAGAADLIPVSGGSGGGGGSNADGSESCPSGSGGGGGGGILIAVNGTATIAGTLDVSGGAGGFLNGCRVAGAGGSGGAVRLVANAIQGTGLIDARGSVSGDGRIRLEAFSNTLGSSDANPAASRLQAPGPVALFGLPDVAITAIAGELLPQPPQGWRGDTDVLLPFPQTVTIELETHGVAANTLVDVTVKPRIGGIGSVQSVAIDFGNCSPTGTCVAFADFDLAAGSYTFEAEATFVTP